MAVEKLGRLPRGRTVTSMDELRDKILTPAVQKISAEFAEQIKREMQNNILDSVYRSYKPKNYNRTYEFYNSVTIYEGNIYRGKIQQYRIGFDKNKMRPRIVERNWNIHADINGRTQSANIARWLDEGTSSGLFTRDGAHFIEETSQFVKEVLLGTDGVRIAQSVTGLRIRKRK